jgi:hypothetical protein
MTNTDSEWNPETMRGYEERYRVAQRNNVGFVLNEYIAGHKVVRQLVNDILLEAQNYFTQGADHPFSAALCAVLGWPSSVTITKVSVRSEKPWVWLDTTSVTRKNLTDANQADYTRHPVL